MILQDEALFLKNVVLATEFNKYIVEHPEIVEKILENASIVIFPQDDPEFCKQMWELIDHHRRIDDMKDRPIVFIRVERLAPPSPSRLINPQIEKIVE